MAESNFYFKDDLEAERERKAAGMAPTLAAPTTAPSPVTPAAPSAPAANTFADLGKAAAAPKPATEKPDYFADFRATLDAQDPFKQKLKANVSQTLDNPFKAFDAGASAQKDMLGNEIAAEGERRRQEAILKSGGQQGMGERAAGAFGNTAIMQQAALGRDLAAGRAQAGEAARSNAIAQGTQLAGQESQDRLAVAQLAQARDLAEKGFSLEESAQELQKQGMSLQDAQYYAGLASQEKLQGKAIASSEKIAYAQIGSNEAMQQSALAHETAENALNRSLDKLLSNDRISAQLQLQALDQDFQERMSTKGFLQTKELEQIRNDFAETLQAKGFDHETAMLIANQKYDSLKAANEQAFQEKMTGINQKFIKGERVETQEWEGSMKALDQRHEDLIQVRAQLHEKGMLTTKIDAEIAENDKARASQEMMAAASLALDDKQFMADLQQKYHFGTEELNLAKKEMAGKLTLMGLQGKQIEGALADTKIRNAMDMAALGMEIGNGSPESMAPFVEALGSSLSGYLKAQGVDISASDFVKGMTATATPVGPQGEIGSQEWNPAKAQEMNIRAVPGYKNVDAYLADNPSGMIKLGKDVFQIIEGGRTRTGASTFSNMERHTDWTKVRDANGAIKYLWGGKVNDAPPKEVSNDISPFGF